jgi:hypothetical protein
VLTKYKAALLFSINKRLYKLRAAGHLNDYLTTEALLSFFFFFVPQAASSVPRTKYTKDRSCDRYAGGRERYRNTILQTGSSLRSRCSASE